MINMDGVGCLLAIILIAADIALMGSYGKDAKQQQSSVYICYKPWYSDTTRCK